MRLKPGTVIERYVVERLIGQGGNAAVYAVQHQELGSYHALKILKGTNEEMYRQLRSEGRAQASVKHPNIVSVIDILNSPMGLGLVMELVEGPRLDSWIGRTVFSVEQLDELASGIIAGVSAAHKAGLVHRDLKPGNIMVAVHHDRLIPKVTDFGLAKILHSSLNTSVPDDGQTKGTPSYMAPEQIRDSGSVDHRADLFSLGAILYEICCAKKCFEGRSLTETLSLIQEGRFVSPRQLRPRLPQRMEEAILAALCVDREARVQTCTALLDLWHAGELQAGRRPTAGTWSRADLEYAVELGQAEKMPAEETADLDAIVSAVEGGPHTPVGKAPEEKPEEKETFDILSFFVEMDSGLLGLLFVGGLIAIGVVFSLVTMEKTLVQLGLAKRDYNYEQATFDGYIGARPCVVEEDGGLLLGSGTSRLRRFGDGSVATLDFSSGVVGEPSCGINGIAYVRQSSAGQGVWVSDWAGAGQKLVVTGGYEPDLSPDGEFVAYQSVPVFNPLARSESGRVYVSKIGEPGIVQIGGDGDAVQPSWAPSGQRIAFWRLNDGTRELWTDRALGGDPVKVRTSTRDHWSPIWTEDGIYYVSDSAGVSKIWRVYVDEESGETRSVSEEVASGTSDAVWHISGNRNGSVLAFESINQRNELQVLGFKDGHWEMGKVIPTGSRLFERPDWSPTRDELVVMSSNAREGLFIVDAESGAVRTLLDEGFRTRSPRWSPDGERVAFYSNRDGAYGIWIINRDGTGIRKVSTEGSFRKPIWTNDGKRLVIHSSDNLSWLLDIETGETELLSAGVVKWHSTSSDGRFLAGWDDSGVHLFDSEVAQSRVIYDSAALPLFTKNPGHMLLATDKEIVALDVDSGEQEVVVRVNNKSIVGFGLSGDESSVVLALSATEGAVWRLIDRASF